ncbi:MAG TPA: Gfo/Idh/MocA family oxidoreductase [Longimicrobiales bacterium]|nr:Gfo/Idh/MocA family oxidoreductase [Longimicrobiales bacterium]
MTAAGPTRVAVVGYGLAGAVFHAPLIDAEEGLTVAAIVTRDPGRSAAARARYPGAAVVADADAVWRMADRLDVAVIATPNRTHVPLGLAALEAGLDVVVDKPLAASAADARRLIEAARGRERLLTVFHNRRWDGDFLTLRRLVAEGELGDVFRLESRFERWRPIPKPGWRQAPAPAEAGGLLFDLGPHLIDQALQLLGPVRHVHAELDRRRPGAVVDDDVFLALTHESGARSHLWMNGIAARPGPRFRVLGSRAAWVREGLDVQESQLRAGTDPRSPGFGVEPPAQWGQLEDGEGSRPAPAEPGAWVAFYAGLRRAVRDGAPPPVDPADAVAGLEIIEAARRQAEGGPASAGPP